MIRSLLVRGMLIGLAAGVLAFAFAFVFGEPQVQLAIDFEEYMAKLSNDPAEAEVVTRGLQRTVGLLLGNVVLGVALGGIFSLVFAWAYGRMGDMSPRLTAVVLALGAYLTVVLIPFTKYPANAPGIGNPETLGRRTILFLAMIVICLLAAIAAARLRRRLIERLDGWNSTLMAVGVFLAVVVVAQLILPAVHETPQGFPADVLYRFRLASLGINATLWATIGLGFGAAAQRLLMPKTAPPAAVAVRA